MFWSVLIWIWTKLILEINDSWAFSNLMVHDLLIVYLIEATQGMCSNRKVMSIILDL